LAFHPESSPSFVGAPSLSMTAASSTNLQWKEGVMPPNLSADLEWHIATEVDAHAAWLETERLERQIAAVDAHAAWLEIERIERYIAAENAYFDALEAEQRSAEPARSRAVHPVRRHVIARPRERRSPRSTRRAPAAGDDGPAPPGGGDRGHHDLTSATAPWGVVS
jgi:hypothetical protein